MWSDLNNVAWPRRLGLAAAFCFLLDRLLKAVALSYPGIVGWSGVMEFALFKNRGIAFSIGLPAPLFWLVITIASVAIIVAFVRSRQEKHILAAAWLTLVMAGAVSNLIDRILYGATIDYLIFFSRSAVNLADGAIIVGLVGWYFRMGQRSIKAAQTSPPKSA